MCCRALPRERSTGSGQFCCCLACHGRLCRCGPACSRLWSLWQQTRRQPRQRAAAATRPKRRLATQQRQPSLTQQQWPRPWRPRCSHCTVSTSQAWVCCAARDPALSSCETPAPPPPPHQRHHQHHPALHGPLLSRHCTWGAECSLTFVAVLTSRSFHPPTPPLLAGGVTREYKQKFQSLRFNLKVRRRPAGQQQLSACAHTLRSCTGWHAQVLMLTCTWCPAQDPHNPDLRAHVLRGEIQPDVFVRMTATELASKVGDCFEGVYQRHRQLVQVWLLAIKLKRLRYIAPACSALPRPGLPASLPACVHRSWPWSCGALWPG